MSYQERILTWFACMLLRPCGEEKAAYHVEMRIFYMQKVTFAMQVNWDIIKWMNETVEMKPWFA